MPSPLETAGAAIRPTATAPLHVNEFFTGLWTNGSPLGPGPVPYLYQRFYMASRYDRLVDGSDIEVSPRLTLIRRPGHSVYNSQLFPPINRFYEFRGFSGNQEVIHLMADCDAPSNQLLNPNFDNGATGWNLESDPGGAGGAWTVTPGGRPVGDGTFEVGNVGMWTGSGSAAISNNAHIPCVPGEQIQASCWSLGDLTATGTAILRLIFYNASNAVISYVLSPPTLANYVWTYNNIGGAAPAGVSYAVVDFAVEFSTGGGRWFVSRFAAGESPIAPTVREVTQPSTNNVLWTKDLSAGRTGFVAVGNVLYAGDGVDTHQWFTSAQNWQPNTQWTAGETIVDPNGNVQMAVGSITATIVNVEVDAVTLSGGVAGRKVTLWFDPNTPFNAPSNIRITTSGMTTVPLANETTPYTVTVESSSQLSWVQSGTSIPVTSPPFQPETGTATTGSGSSGAGPVSWNTNFGQITQDGSNQWVNMGSSVMQWGGAGPTSGPIVTQALAPSVYPQWAPNTWYAPQGAFMVIDSSGNIQQVQPPGGTTGAPTGPPSWTPGGAGAITVDGSVTWVNQGTAAWQANHSYAVGACVQVTYTYTITVPTPTYIDGKFIMVMQAQQTTATGLFQVTTAGVSGANPPNWVNGVGTSTKEASGLTWKNLGATTSYPTGGHQNISTAVKVIDSNGYFEQPSKQGESGATQPTNWAKTLGTGTPDNSQVWINAGAYSTAATDPWMWEYSGKNSITGEISDPSPASPPFVPSLGDAPIIQGQGLPNPPWDTIVLWRTMAGGSQFLYEDEFPNPGPTATWVYTDTTPDTTLQANTQNPAPIAGTNGNDPPPDGFVPLCYYLGRIWGYVGNELRWSGGPDTVTGNGNSTFPTKNRFTFPATGVVCWPTSIGLICYTTSDIWAVMGQGTDTSAFYAVMFQAGVGMLSADAFAVNGSTAYGMITSHQVVSMDPGAGEVEVGFPLANVFDDYYDPALAYLTWHQGFSKDTALYVANGSQYWYRMAAVAAPESGNVWSPAAVIHAPGGVRAIASVEITPGKKKLVLGPNIDGNPILMRDPTTNTDNGVTYPAHGTIAAVILAQPGTTAGVQFVVTEERLIDGATPLTVNMLFDEIEDYVHIHQADWRELRNRTNEPPNLPLQKSIRAQRHWATQDPSTLIKCRFYQQDISWIAENFPNEIYTNTVFGRLPEKARK